jgi:hypothetical protein
MDHVLSMCTFIYVCLCLYLRILCYDSSVKSVSVLLVVCSLWEVIPTVIVTAVTIVYFCFADIDSLLSLLMFFSFVIQMKKSHKYSDVSVLFPHSCHRLSCRV